PAYTESLRLERTTPVKARAFAPGLDDRFVATAAFTKVTPREAVVVAPGSLVPGLSCRTYEGDWRTPPDFAAVKSTGTVTLATVSVPTDRSTERFGMACLGFFAVPADGLYTFKLRSADGSELRLDGEPVVQNESPDFISRFGVAALAAGLHRIEVRYVHGTFVAGLELDMDGPGRPLAPVPAQRLFHLVEAP
ncbi:MAG: PA14 domain-containing protein, partial [Thermoanaerobaculales bacterium]